MSNFCRRLTWRITSGVITSSARKGSSLIHLRDLTLFFFFFCWDVLWFWIVIGTKGSMSLQSQKGWMLIHLLDLMWLLMALFLQVYLYFPIYRYASCSHFNQKVLIRVIYLFIQGLGCQVLLPLFAHQQLLLWLSLVRALKRYFYSLLLSWNKTFYLLLIICIGWVLAFRKNLHS